MAEINTETINILQEWAPLSDFLNQIPHRTQNRLFNQDICLTCVDVLSEYIAVGTNIGLVYWYDRHKKYLQRLRCENSTCRVTVVKVLSTVDFMVACGTSDGQISIFQIPKTHPATLPESLKPKAKQIERYTVSDLHTGRITCLEWAKNGMKLFSGDQNGIVVLTEIDFYMHLSKSADILNEAYEVVQLSYCQQHLLVSTTYRTIVCRKEEKWKICQVGKKDRKVLGNLGAVFWKNSLRPKDLVVYCARPGLRIWISDLDGTVKQTLLFKDLLNKECFEVPLINPISDNAKKLKPLREATFGVLLPFADSFLVTYSSEVIYVLDPINLLVIATISHLRRILSVTVHKDEIFLLEGDRSLLRISFKPESILSDTATHPIPSASTFLPLTSSLKDLTNKLQTSSIISAFPPLFESSPAFDIHTDSTAIIRAEEALELPNKWQAFDKISAEEFDDHILFKHRRRKKRRSQNSNVSNAMNTSVTSSSSASSDDRDGQINQPCILNMSTNTILPDLRSSDSILHDIEHKEKMLADLLHLDTVKLSTFENETKSDEHSSTITNGIVHNIPNSFLPQCEFTTTNFKTESKLTFEESAPISYGPPSGSSNPTSVEPPACLAVPTVWKLQDITINQETNELSDSSLCDWEII